MLASFTGLLVTMRSLWEGIKKPVTSHYPRQHKPIELRYMGFPALTWDDSANEPYCTGCMVCIKACPTECMTAVMQDNPKAQTGESHRRKIIQKFEINLGRCILCGICAEVCNLDAITMSHEHELASFLRNGNRANLGQLVAMGRIYQDKVSWQPSFPERNHAGTVLAAREEKLSDTSSVAKPDQPAAQDITSNSKNSPHRNEATTSSTKTSASADIPPVPEEPQVSQLKESPDSPQGDSH